jgi:hypothetical protein
MEKIIDACIGFIEIAVVTGVIGYGGAMSFRALHDKVRTETIEALKRPTPSLSRFTKQLTAPNSR